MKRFSFLHFMDISFEPDYIFATPLNWSTSLADVPLLHPAVGCHITYKVVKNSPENEMKKLVQWSGYDSVKPVALWKKSEVEIFEVESGPGVSHALCFVMDSVDQELSNASKHESFSGAAVVFTSKKGTVKVGLTMYCWPQDLRANAPEWYNQMNVGC